MPLIKRPIFSSPFLMSSKEILKLSVFFLNKLYNYCLHPEKICFVTGLKAYVIKILNECCFSVRK